MTTRRAVLAGGIHALAGVSLASCLPHDASDAARLEAQFRLIEVATGGAFGVALYDPKLGGMIGYRGGERFAMASTFKTSLAAMAQAGRLDPDERTRWTEADLVSHRPFTGERMATGATWRELAYAAQTVSDNVAANLLLKRLGGPAAMTAFWRGAGDTVSRLDRFEPDLNRVPPGDLRDTTTPAAMARTLHTLLFAETGNPLSAERQAELRRWMAESTTGLKRVRAGLPSSWAVGDKTGNSGNWPDAPYLRGDIGYVVGPRDRPVTFAAYHRSPFAAPIDGARVDAGFAQIGAAMADYIGHTDLNMTRPVQGG